MVRWTGDSTHPCGTTVLVTIRHSTEFCLHHDVLRPLCGRPVCPNIVRLTSIACSFSTRRWDSVVLKALQHQQGAFRECLGPVKMWIQFMSQIQDGTLCVSVSTEGKLPGIVVFGAFWFCVLRNVGWQISCVYRFSYWLTSNCSLSGLVWDCSCCNCGSAEC